MAQEDLVDRLTVPFSDPSKPGKIEVGLPVRMVFRIRNVDKQRNFTQYYWKAKPVIKKKEA